MGCECHYRGQEASGCRVIEGDMALLERECASAASCVIYRSVL